MKRLPARDLKALSDAIGHLNHEVHADMPKAILEGLSRLMPAIEISIESIDLASGEMNHLCSGKPFVEPETAQEILREFGHENPALSFAMEAGGAFEGAIRISDFVSWRQFRQTGYWKEVNKLLPFRDQGGFAFVAERNLFAVAAFRDTKFSDEEALLLELWRAHAAMAMARELRLAQVPPAGLTLREKEVLEWLVEGKTDGEIAVILSISERTVNTHVARILNKLEVENRASAVARVWRWRVGRQD